MIDNEMSCSPNPQWLKDFKQEIQEEFNLSSLDATCIAGKVARIVRKRDRKACDAYCHHCPNYADDAIGLQGCSGRGCDVLRDFHKAMEE